MASHGKQGIWTVIGASSAGTVIEWYDFYIFGTLATFIAAKFFPKGNDTVAFMQTLATFAVGFVVRPFGAIFFGAIGDIVGRKYTFLVTLVVMGLSTALIGVLPSYEQIGIMAPLLLLLLRMLQGLALGGEYGGAATYVAEHAPAARRGFYTSFIQTTATLGLFISLGVILTTRLSMEKAAFEQWGWRIPFLLSAVLVVFSYAVRRRLKESPIYAEMKAAGKASKTPLRDSFTKWPNLKLVIIALIGATAGQGVVWYTGQFYALYYLQTVLKIDYVLAYKIIAVSLLCATPFFVVFGSLSDRIGRKKIILAGFVCAAASYLPIFHAMVTASGLNLADPSKPLHPPDVYSLGALIFVLVFWVTMVYGPIAAFLVEIFPTQIRYTSMSLPYHIGNGVFGGLVPLIGTWMVGRTFLADGTTHNIYAGLWYPMAIAVLTFLFGLFLLKDRTGAALDEIK